MTNQMRHSYYMIELCQEEYELIYWLVERELEICGIGDKPHKYILLKTILAKLEVI